MYRVSKGDITIEVDTEVELMHAVIAIMSTSQFADAVGNALGLVGTLTDHNVPIPSIFGVTEPPPEEIHETDIEDVHSV